MGVFVHSSGHLPTLLTSRRSCIGTEATIVSHPRVYVSGVKLQKVPNCGKSSFAGPFNILDFCLSFYTQSHRPADPFSCWIKVKCCASVPDIFFPSKPKRNLQLCCSCREAVQPCTSESHTRIYCVMQRERGAVHILQVNITSTVIKSYTLNSARHGEIWMHTSMNPIPAVIPNLYATVTTCPSRTLIISLAENMTRVPGTADQYKTLHCHSQYYGKWQLWTNFEQFHG